MLRISGTTLHLVRMAAAVERQEVRRLPRAVLDNSTMADFIEPRRAGSRSVNAFGATVTPDHWILERGFHDDSEDDIEPPLPAGLRTLTPAQTALAAFLLIDPDWLAAAAEGSAPLGNQADEDPAIAAWLELQTPAQIRTAVDKRLQGGTGAGYEQALHAVKDLSEALSLTDRLARLLGDEQKAVKTTSFAINSSPTRP